MENWCQQSLWDGSLWKDSSLWDGSLRKDSSLYAMNPWGKYQVFMG